MTENESKSASPADGVEGGSHQPSRRAVCRRCRRVIDVGMRRCPGCGAILIATQFRQIPIIGSVIAMCAVLFLGTLILDPSGVGGGGLFGFLSPSGPALWAFGMSGGQPVAQGRWWTILSAGWLHGSLLHIVVNMGALRQIGPPVLRLYGPARFVVIWVASGTFGFSLTAAASTFESLPVALQGANATVGASASLFGLLGILWGWSRQADHEQLQRQMQNMVGMWLLIGIAAGFSTTGGIRLDNWAHLGGFLAGAGMAWALPAGQPETSRDKALATVAAVVSLAAVVASLLTSVRLA